MKKFECKPPYLGCAYYPEDWPESEMEYDVAMMKKAGINCARIAEFAWSRMEPKPGEFDFSWLHRVVDHLRENGIAVVMCTPSATPPQWLIDLHPDVVTEREDGRRTSHGGRRHCCSCNPHYIEYSLRIAEEMAKEFANDPAIIGWQIDNEIYTWPGSACFCPHCERGFRDYLRGRYKTVKDLNAAWDNTTWSQEYTSFDTVITPRNGRHQPHLRQAWYTYQNERHIDFVHMQADILHKYVKVPVGTDTMPVNGMDYHRLQAKLDVAQFNHYNEPDNLYKAFLWFDYLRTMKKEQPFWNTETQTCWNGHDRISQSLKPDGFCVANSLAPLILGGEANMYWLWRAHFGGHEIMHGSVLDTSGRPMHIFGEVQETAAIMQKAADFVNGTRVKTPVAMHYSPTNWNMLLAQPAVEGINNDDIYRFYRPMLDLGLRPDVIDPHESLDNYRILFSPMAMTMEECDLPARVSEWVKDGGVLIAGPLSDLRKADGTRYQDKPYGFLEELTGARWLYNIPDRIHAVKAAFTEAAGTDATFSGDMWYEIWEQDGGIPLSTVTAGHSALLDRACVMDCPVGNGHVILLGTFPDRAGMQAILAYACRVAGVTHGQTEGEVLVAEREGEKMHGVMLMEYSGVREGRYRFHGKMTDILTGREYENEVTLPPYGVMMLKK